MFLRWTLIRLKSDKRSSDIVDRSHVFALRKVLNNLNAVQTFTGRVRAILIAWRTAGNKSSVLQHSWSSPSPLYVSPVFLFTFRTTSLFQLLNFQHGAAYSHFQLVSCILACSFAPRALDKARKDWKASSFQQETVFPVKKLLSDLGKAQKSIWENIILLKRKHLHEILGVPHRCQQPLSRRITCQDVCIQPFNSHMWQNTYYRKSKWIFKRFVAMLLLRNVEHRSQVSYPASVEGAHMSELQAHHCMTPVEWAWLLCSVSVIPANKPSLQDINQLIGIKLVLMVPIPPGGTPVLPPLRTLMSFSTSPGIFCFTTEDA